MEKNKQKKKNRFLKRIFKPITFFSEILVDGAVKEISAVIKDYVTALIGFIFSVIFFLFFWFLVNILSIVALHDFANIDYFFSVLIMSCVNLLFSIIFIMFAKSKIDRK